MFIEFIIDEKHSGVISAFFPGVRTRNTNRQFVYFVQNCRANAIGFVFQCTRNVRELVYFMKFIYISWLN